MCLLVVSGPGYMAQSGTYQHQGRVSVRERPHYAGPTTDLSVQPFNHIVGAYPCPTLIGESTVSQRFLNAVLHFPGGFLQPNDYSLGFFPCSLLVFLCMKIR